MATAMLLATLPAVAVNAEPATTPVLGANEATAMSPSQWCRPVVNAAIDPAPLTCWLTLAATEPGSPPANLTGMNLGELPPWGDIDVEAIGASITRYEQALAAERAPATQTPTRRPGTQPARGGSGGGDTCGLKPGDFPTPAQLACMGVGEAGGGGGSTDWDWDGDWDPDTHDDSPLPHDDTFEPIEGPDNDRPPPPTNCPNGWRYWSDTGYYCL